MALLSIDLYIDITQGKYIETYIPKQEIKNKYMLVLYPARKRFCTDAPENIDVLDVVNEHINIFLK